MSTASAPQGRNEIRRLLAAHGLRPDTGLGQHFLADPNIVERIVRVAGVQPGWRVLEVGAGTGTLTRALCAAGASVTAYEVDVRLRPVLEAATAGLDVDLRFADARDLDVTADLEPGPWVMVANLPYHVGTRLLLDLLRDAPSIRRFVVMVQREVADRLIARPGSRTYGVPSVIVALRASAAFGFAVPPQVFIPAPEVSSAVVVLDRIDASPLAGQAEELAHAAFGQRRKMLRRALAGHLDDPDAAFGAAGIDPTARAETLSAEDFLRLAAVAR